MSGLVKKLKKFYNSVMSGPGVKPEDLQGPVVKKVYRFFGIFVAKNLMNTKITPNQLTYLSFACAVLSAFLFYFGEYRYLVLGAVFLLVSLILDYADGSLARMRDVASDYGKFLDLGFDELGKVAVFFGITFGVYTQHQTFVVWILGFLAITSSMMVGLIYTSFRRLFPFAVEVIEDEKKERRILKQFFYLEHNIRTTIIIFALINQFYILLAVFAVYGWLFAITTFFLLCKKSSKILKKKV